MSSTQNEEITIPRHEILTSIFHELHFAKKQHLSWPNDIIHAAAIVGEESGELTRAALQHTYENGSIKAAEKEAIQVAVTAIRFLEGLNHYRKE